MSTGVHVQPSSFNRWIQTTTKSVEGVKHNQILPLPLPKQNRPNLPKETLLLLTYFRMGLS